MEVINTKLADIKLIKPKIFRDTRGFFFEGFQAERYAELLKIDQPIVQINFSYSQHSTLRGLHYQLLKPQDKILTILHGKIFDVAVDIRKHSSTFGQWVGSELSDENHYQMYIPKGFAHGFSVLSKEVYFCYACTEFYDPSSEKGILWSDPNLNISWGVQTPILSEKDKYYRCLNDIPSDELL